MNLLWWLAFWLSGFASGMTVRGIRADRDLWRILDGDGPRRRPWPW